MISGGKPDSARSAAYGPASWILILGGIIKVVLRLALSDKQMQTEVIPETKSPPG